MALIGNVFLLQLLVWIFPISGLHGLITCSVRRRQYWICKIYSRTKAEII